MKSRPCSGGKREIDNKMVLVLMENAVTALPDGERLMITGKDF